MRELKVMIGTPTTGSVETGYCLSMLAMNRFMIQNPQVSEDQVIVDFTLFTSSGSLLPKQRDEVIKAAIASKATHILFIDSDQTFPYDTFHVLARAKKEVIACNISTKSSPPDPTARDYDESDVAGRPVYSTENRPEIEKIWRIGTGVMLIDVEALVEKQIPLPWFLMTYNSVQHKHEGEDWYFCRMLKRFNIPVWIHHHLSLQIGHIGKFTYKHEHVNNHRKLVMNKQAKAKELEDGQSTG